MRNISSTLPRRQKNIFISYIYIYIYIYIYMVMRHEVAYFCVTWWFLPSHRLFNFKSLYFTKYTPYDSKSIHFLKGNCTRNPNMHSEIALGVRQKCYIDLNLKKKYFFKSHFCDHNNFCRPPMTKIIIFLYRTDPDLSNNV